MKKISAEQLYEAMDGIGEDLLARSEQNVSSASVHKKRNRRNARRMLYAALSLAAALLLFLTAGAVLRNRRGMGETSSSAPAMADKAQEEILTEETVITEAAEEDADAGDGLPVAPSQQMMPAEQEAAEAAAEEFKATQPEASAKNENGGKEYGMTEDAVSADMAALFVYNGKRYREADRVAYEAHFIGDYVTSITYGIDEWTDEADYAEGEGTVAGDVYLYTADTENKALCMVEEDGNTILIFRTDD